MQTVPSFPRNHPLTLLQSRSRPRAPLILSWLMGKTWMQFSGLTQALNDHVHRDSERQLHFDSKFEHEEMVLVA